VATATHISASALDLLVADVPPECLVAVAGELDMASAPALASALRGLDSEGEVVTLDLRAVTFMDVAGLRGVLEARRFASLTGRRLEVLGPGPEASRVAELTGNGEVLS
jgi:anti-sigma B factor antagonist